MQKITDKQLQNSFAVNNVLYAVEFWSIAELKTRASSGYIYLVSENNKQEFRND